MQKKNNKYNIYEYLLINFIKVLFVYIWLYTFVLAILWGFFIILKMHAYKFKNFSNNITKITNILLIFLWILSLIWYILIFFLDTNDSNTVKVDTSVPYKEVYY